MTYELYRLDKPDEVVCEVNAYNARSALSAAAYRAMRKNEVFLYSSENLTAVCEKGALGARCKGKEVKGLPPVKGTMDDIDGMPLRGRRRREAVPA